MLEEQVLWTMFVGICIHLVLLITYQFNLLESTNEVNPIAVFQTALDAR